MRVESIDHLVLTVRNLQTSCAFYVQVLGMEEITFGEGRRALRFGDQKINLHQSGQEIPPVALFPVPGSADVCFVTNLPLSQVVEHVRGCGIEVLEGPVRKEGARGPIDSVYFRDPDGNLIEVSSYEVGARG